jgi:glycosyltransferase involved in cell wall biosynthesis
LVADSMKTVSVIMPVFNEEKTIGEILSRVRKAPTLGLDKEIIIVDDASTDGTRKWLQGVIDEGVRCVFHERNQGKGAALRTGFSQAKGDIVIIQDADLEYNPEEYPKLLQPIVDDRADVVLSSRFLTGEEHRVLYFWHAVGNRILTLVSNMFTNLNLTDMESGYKVFRQDILKRISIRENRFGFEAEIVAKVASQRCRIYEVGVSYAGRTYEEGKKITWKDGFRALWCIIRYSAVFGGKS